MKTTWKDIAPVPTSQEFLDIVLSRTQRRLPTQIRAGFKITRIRAFYIRKVKYTSETFTEKLTAILDGFPRLEDIHPFHKDLLNTLYDKDHFKIALGQCSTAKHLIETVARDYVRLLKYGQSLYQCKQLKRAGLGRMATICKRLRDPLAYLEQVRQHLGRLPSIDPNTRTLLICGYPNVGKSSFLRSISRADVDVQPYAFTTKSLFVGHFDYKMLRFQAIDTPGILDHPLEEMNTIEMQSITAIAHLRSAILYFMDLSEQCGYPVAQQIALFQSIKPLFANKLAFIVINKIDLCQISDLDSETQSQLNALISSSEVELLTLSCTTTENVMGVRNAVCERLIASRNAQKLAHSTTSTGEPTGRLADLLRRIHVAQPLGGVTREPFIPAAVAERIKYDKEDPARRKLERDLQDENGGPGVYSIDLKKNYKEIEAEQVHDIIPEFLNGRNVADFVDPDIARKLSELEAEEEKLDADGFYESDEEPETLEQAETHYKADLIREKRQLLREEAKQRKSLNNRAVMPRNKGLGKPLTQMTKHLASLGHDTTAASARARSRSQARAPREDAVTRGRSSASAGADADAMDIDYDADPRDAIVGRAASRAASKSKARAYNTRDQSMARARGPREPSRAREPSVNRRVDGVTDPKALHKAEKLTKLGQRKMNRMARQGEADRHTTAALPKHLFSGKRGIGKTNSR